MTRRSRVRKGSARVWAALAGALVVLTVLAAPSSATTPCTTKPAVYPLADVSPGLMGTGYTVVQGETPEAFDVKVLGVVPDGIAPGLDFILVQVSGGAADETGGIAAGYSGSPVYVGGKLLGAVSYGFYGDATIGGVTPGKAMTKIFDYPDASAAATPATKVHLPDALRRAAARAAGTSVSAMDASAHQLPVPFSVSGLNTRGVNDLQGRLDQMGVNAVAYRGGTASAPTSTVATPLEPGQSLSATISYGDLTQAGIGTATAVCGDYVVGFGHPFFFEGPTLFGMDGADVLGTVQDPEFGSFKLANVAEHHGTVEQDRLAGIRGVEGSLPALTPVVSRVTNLDSGRVRQGRTDIVRQDFVAETAAFHTLLNMDTVNDRIGGGTAHMTFTIQGTSPDGNPFSFTRQDDYTSSRDITPQPANDLYDFTHAIQSSKFGNANIDKIRVDATLQQQQDEVKIAKVLTSSDTEPALKERKRLNVHKGDSVSAELHLKEPDGSDQVVDLTFTVPTNASRYGYLEFVGGGRSGLRRHTKAKSFDDLLTQLSQTTRNADLVASMRIRTKTDGKSKYVEDTRVLPQSAPVSGRAFVRLELQKG